MIVPKRFCVAQAESPLLSNSKSVNRLDTKRYSVHLSPVRGFVRPKKAGLAGPVASETQMARKPQDKTAIELRFLLNNQGLTFYDVDRTFGLKPGTARIACRHPHLKGELALAETLGLNPNQIWPSRFDPKTGARLKPQPTRNYRDQLRLRTSQKQRAA